MDKEKVKALRKNALDKYGQYLEMNHKMMKGKALKAESDRAEKDWDNAHKKWEDAMLKLADTSYKEKKKNKNKKSNPPLENLDGSIT